MDRLDNFEIILCRTPEEAMKAEPDIMIEAEYGSTCVEGKELTLAHHGPRADNPAPCNTDTPVFDSGRIVISHVDLDTVGGILAVTGEKPNDPEFWRVAERIDVDGPHYLHEFNLSKFFWLDSFCW